MTAHIPFSPLFSTFLALAVLTGTGCAFQGGAEPVVSQVWELEEYIETGDRAVATEEATFTLHLAKDSRASGQVACNRWQGTYRRRGDELHFSGLSSTKRRCLLPTAALTALEQRFLRRLEQGASVALDGERLVLRYADGERWYFREKAQ